MKRQSPRIAVAPDSFKGSLTALGAALCIEKGIKMGWPGATVIKIPMADGGEGTVNAVIAATGGRLLRRFVHDPLGRRIPAEFGLSGEGATAIIEMAAASGLPLLSPRERNPLLTSTRGTGELIRHALSLGATRILMGIGGSATNDGGTGMARAMGLRFLDRDGKEIPEGGGALGRLDRIDVSRRDTRLNGIRLEVACDVTNPLTGPRGASRVYGPQKGATPAMVQRLDTNLKHLARIVRRDCGVNVLNVPGAGAAGGLGAGLMAFLGARLRRGVDIVIECTRLEDRLKGCDLVITGEGRMDGQTLFGKTPAGVAAVARKLGIPVIAICGCLGPGIDAMHRGGIDAFFSALEESMPEADLPHRGPAMLTRCAAQVARVLRLGGLKRIPTRRS